MDHVPHTRRDDMVRNGETATCEFRTILVFASFVYPLLFPLATTCTVSPLFPPQPSDMADTERDVGNVLHDQTG